MKLYVCYGTFRASTTPRSGHPCRIAHRALLKAGWEPHVVRAYGWGALPELFNKSRGRREVRELTGNHWVPALVTDEGEVVQGSAEIVAWAGANRG
jgi:hypothetical protein